MKKTLALCCIFCALLCGCSATANGDAQQNTDGGVSQSTLGDTQNTLSDQIALDAAQTRADYYEGLVDTLQQEVLALKAQLYTSKVEYESKLAELKGNGTSSLDPSEVQFEYTVTNGVATLTAYRGEETEVRIPNTLGGYPVASIADKAFENNTKLSSVTIPAGVSKIGWFAFSGCVFLTDVTLPASLQSIDYGAFENCSSALTVRCPSGSYAQQYARSYGLRTVS